MYPNREIFPESPLALVAVEIRFTDAARLRQQQTKDEIAIALEDRFPFADRLNHMDVSLAESEQPQVQNQSGVVLKNKASSESLTVTSDSLTYETTAYTSFDDLLSAVAVACDALIDAKVRPALQRIGLRYIDEVRVPTQITDARQWSQWVDKRLVDQLYVGPDQSHVKMMQGVNSYDLGDGRGLNFRYAALDQGPIVVPKFLTRSFISSGPFFVLDFDGFHELSSGQTVPLSSSIVSESLTAVHAPCGTAFQRSITDAARALFRGEQS